MCIGQFFFNSIFDQGIQFSRASLNGVLNTTQNKDNKYRRYCLRWRLSLILNSLSIWALGGSSADPF